MIFVFVLLINKIFINIKNFFIGYLLRIAFLFLLVNISMKITYLKIVYPIALSKG